MDTTRLFYAPDIVEEASSASVSARMAECKQDIERAAQYEGSKTKVMTAPAV